MTNEQIVAMASWTLDDFQNDPLVAVEQVRELAAAHLSLQQERDAAVRDIEPMPLDEVRELGREPVYIVSLGEDFDDGWQLCVGVVGDYAHFLMFYHLLHLNHYGKTWVAYRRPPKEASDG